MPNYAMKIRMTGPITEMQATGETKEKAMESVVQSAEEGASVEILQAVEVPGAPGATGSAGPAKTAEHKAVEHKK